MEAAECLYFNGGFRRFFPSCNAAAWWHFLSTKMHLSFLPILVRYATSHLAASNILSFSLAFSSVSWYAMMWTWVYPACDFLDFFDVCIYGLHQMRRVLGHDFFILLLSTFPFWDINRMCFRPEHIVPRVPQGPLTFCSALVLSVLQLRKFSASDFPFAVSVFVQSLPVSSLFHRLPFRCSDYHLILLYCFHISLNYDHVFF